MSLTKQWQIINQTKWQVNDNLTVRNIASYGEFYAQSKNATFGEYLPAGRRCHSRPAVLQLVLSGEHSDRVRRALGHGGTLLPRANQWTFTEELQLVGSLPRLDWQAGVYYEKSKSIGQSGGQQRQLLGLPGQSAGDRRPAPASPYSAPPAPSSRRPSIQSKFQDVGIYAQATYALLDNLKLTGGIRYTWDEVEGSTVAATQRAVGGPFTCTFAPVVGPTADQSGDRNTGWRADHQSRTMPGLARRPNPMRRPGSSISTISRSRT